MDPILLKTAILIGGIALILIIMLIWNRDK